MFSGRESMGIVHPPAASQRRPAVWARPSRASRLAIAVVGAVNASSENPPMAPRDGTAARNAARTEERGADWGVSERLTDTAHPAAKVLDRGLAWRLATAARPVLGPAHGVALEHGLAVLAVAVAGAPRLGVVVRARVELDEIELMALGEGDRRLGELRGPLVLVGIEVSPHREGDAIDGVPAERGGDPLACVHSSANVVSAMRSRSRAARTLLSVSVASSIGRSCA